MQADKKTISLLIPSLLILILSGCSLPDGPVKLIFPPNSAAPQQSRSVEKRFQESASKGPSIIDSAIELSQKYAKLSEETALLRQKKQNLTSENLRLRNQATNLQGQLHQAQKELTEANDLLIEMRIELNNWKVDILGFRDEIREADTEQLKALIKILEVLGGEIKAKSAHDQQAGSPAISPPRSGRSRPQQTINFR